MTDKATTTVVGGLLRAIRKQRALTQEQFALEAGVASSYISRIEEGHREPSRDTIGLFCRVLGLDAADQNRLYVAAGYVPPGCWVVLDEYLIKADEAMTVTVGG